MNIRNAFVISALAQASSFAGTTSSNINTGSSTSNINSSSGAGKVNAIAQNQHDSPTGNEGSRVEAYGAETTDVKSR